MASSFVCLFVFIGFWSQGDYVWIEPSTKREFDVAIGARVVSAEGKRIQVVDDDGKVRKQIETKQKRATRLGRSIALAAEIGRHRALASHRSVRFRWIFHAFGTRRRFVLPVVQSCLTGKNIF